jgi:amidohydrolase
MSTIPTLEAQRDELVAWRRDLHAHPELAYEEKRTASFVAAELRRAGLEVHEGLARTGVVGTLSTADGAAVGLRADMDALPIDEANTVDYRSRFDGRMHACGHDGHTVMLLAAARHLASHADFEGTVRFIFQPAEEAAGGAGAMLREGLFDRFPVDRVFGMHNWPGLAAGRFAMRRGPIMASIDCFDGVIEGRGTHGALPHSGVDPIVAFAHVVAALQTVVARNVDPLQPAVLSVTKVRAGHAHNVIPPSVAFGGAIRCLDPEVRKQLKRRLAELVRDVASGLGASGSVQFGYENPAVRNESESTRLAAAVAAELVGEGAVSMDAPPVLASEDFALMLERKPGCYVLIGNGAAGGACGCAIHDPGYDFNDEILTLGASYWVRLAERALGAPAGRAGQPA